MNKATLLSAAAFLALQPVGAKAQNTGSAQLHSSVAHKSSTKPTILSGELSGDGKTPGRTEKEGFGRSATRRFSVGSTCATYESKHMLMGHSDNLHPVG